MRMFQDHERIVHDAPDLEHEGILGHRFAVDVDVCHTVFGFASGSTLLACSRVSWMWREISLPFLFRSLEICRNSSYDDFLQFLDKKAIIARYIRDLTLAYAPPSLAPPTPHDVAFEINAKINKFKRPVVDRILLATLADKLPRLRELKLHYISAGALPAPDCIADKPKSELPRLRRLSIEGCWSAAACTDTACDIYTLLDIFTALPADSLYTKDIYVSVEGGPPQSDSKNHQGQLDMHTLLMEGHPYYFDPRLGLLYDAFRQATAPRCLRRLRLDRMTRRSISCLHSLGNFLYHAGRDALREFELSFDINGPIHPLEDDPGYWSVLRLDECCNLESFGILLALNNVNNGEPPPRVPYSAVCIAILAHITPALRRLTITLMSVIREEQITSNETLCLRALDNMLEERFPALEVIRLEMRQAKLNLLECATAAFEVMPRIGDTFMAYQER
ncbi:hypothetical protein ONZ51_g73 [Trametes cubensis]|uniref:F-box domain-containing protein n=1 Tax=Trametes cubensis TaxID=1111947 RepID=A0AAD7U653_9APHY|nr:hypothetical protein ONZ51_g73 [Trametes cubensis]